MPIDEIVGDSIDRIISIEMRFGAGLPRGVIHRLYDATRQKHGQPLCFMAAQALQKRVARGRNVLVVTGAGMPPGLPKGETDGPPGAAAIAHALDVGLGGKPILISEDRNMPPVIAAVEAAGVAVVDEGLFKQRGGVALAIEMPLGPEAGKKAATEYLDRYDPAAVIFIEKAGPNEKGVFHSINGSVREPKLMANAHFIAEAARSRGILTIGVGDGGNEIGCGVIAEAARDIQPYGRRCQCPCQGSIITVCETDILVMASVSNWGAYGIAAAIAGLTENREALHDEATERRVIERCVAAGAMDGAYARLIPYADGTRLEVQTSLITLLHEVVGNGLRSYDRGF